MWHYIPNRKLLAFRCSGREEEEDYNAIGHRNRRGTRATRWKEEKNSGLLCLPSRLPNEPDSDDGNAQTECSLGKENSTYSRARNKGTAMSCAALLDDADEPLIYIDSDHEDHEDFVLSGSDADDGLRIFS